MFMGDVEIKLQWISERLMKPTRMLCSSCSAQSTDASPIIDIERVLQDYAWRELKRDSRWYHVLRRNDYIIEVPWNFFEFDHKTFKFVPRHGQPDNGYREKKQVELFTTDCRNNTGHDQVYKLKTERQTKASTVVTFHRGFTMGGNAHFRLQIPPHIGNCGVMASADGHLRVTCCKGQTFDETFTWTVDSDIKVEAYHVTNAKLIVTEDELVADFEVRTRLRMPTGEAPIIIKRRRDNQIYAVLVISDLSDAFADVDCSIVNILRENEDSKKGQYVIELITTGILESIRWRDQRICLESQRIASAPHIPPPQDISESTMYSTNMLTRMLQQATKEVELGFPLVEEAASSPPQAKTVSDPVVETKVERKGLRFNIIPTIITDIHEDTDDTSDSEEDATIADLPAPTEFQTTSIMKHRMPRDIVQSTSTDSSRGVLKRDKPVTVTYYAEPEICPMPPTVGPEGEYDVATEVPCSPPVTPTPSTSLSSVPSPTFAPSSSPLSDTATSGARTRTAIPPNTLQQTTIPKTTTPLTTQPQSGVTEAEVTAAAGSRSEIKYHKFPPLSTDLPSPVKESLASAEVSESRVPPPHHLPGRESSEPAPHHPPVSEFRGPAPHQPQVSESRVPSPPYPPVSEYRGLPPPYPPVSESREPPPHHPPGRESRGPVPHHPPVSESRVRWTSVESRSSFEEKLERGEKPKTTVTHIDTPDSVDSPKLSKVTSV